VQQTSRRWLVRGVAGLMVVTVIGGASPASATTAQSPTTASAAAPMGIKEHLNALAGYGKNYLNRLRPEMVGRLSPGAQTLTRLAQGRPAIDKLAATQSLAQTQRPQGPRAARAGFANDVNAAEDLFSRLAGMTQNQPSAAWCGTNAVIGFNDSGSFISAEFLSQSPSGSLSFNGWSQSTNAGGSWTDRGALISDPIPDDLVFRDLLGVPVLGCTSRSNFYYASLVFDIGQNNAFANAGIAVMTSADGGTTFSPPNIAASQDANLHILDKPWLAVQPGPTSAPGDDIVHVSYTNVDFSGFVGEGPCLDQVRTAIEYVRSADGGRTWSEPQVMDEACELQGILNGSMLEPDVIDDVLVAWERFPFDPTEQRQIFVRRTSDPGETLLAPSVVANVTPIGDSSLLQGQFGVFFDLQGMAIDRSSGPRRGNIYITYQDGSARQKPDPAGFCLGDALYCFGDVHLVRSTDGGATWSAPVRINNDDIRLGIDQFMPALDVDRSGALWVTYYDRRNDERNFMIDTFVARSTNGGASWSNTRATTSSFPPITGIQDLLFSPIYMGDYITIAADSTGRYAGAIAAWGDNRLGDANVMQRKFQ
jgi:hypothetical protein